MLRRIYAAIPSHSGEQRDMLVGEIIPGFERYRLARDAEGRPALLIRAEVSEGASTQGEVRLRQISLRPSARCRVRTGDKVTEESLTIVQSEMTAPEIVDLFLDVMGVWMAVIGPTPSQEAAVESFAQLARMFESLAMPSRSDIRGTWGELFLAAIATDPAHAVRAWHPGASETYDFADESGAVEAKTCYGPARSHVFSLSQLTDESAARAHLASLILTDDVEGASLSDLLALLAERMPNARLQLRALEILTELLGSSWRQAERARFDALAALGSLRLYEIPSIPRIDPEAIPPEVSEVRLRVDLSTVAPIDPGQLRSDPALRGAMLPGLSLEQLSALLQRLQQRTSQPPAR